MGLSVVVCVKGFGVVEEMLVSIEEVVDLPSWNPDKQRVAIISDVPLFAAAVVVNGELHD